MPSFAVAEKILTSSDGVQIYASASGNSHLPALVFIHGLTLSALVWAQLMSNPALLKSFYLVAYDLRGHGRSGKPSTLAGHASALYAADFEAVVRGFNLNSPILVGWSLGGTIAADVCAHLGPDAISGIIWTTPMPYIGPIVAEVAKPYVQSLFPGLASIDNVTLAVETRTAFVDSLFNHPESVPAAIKWLWLGTAFQQPPALLEIVTGRAQDPAGLFAAGERGLPALLITSGPTDKQLNGEPVVRLLQQHFTDYKVVEVLNGSHAVFYDFEALYVKEVTKFAERVFAGRGRNQH